jgi:HK97 gp10 family phage protein
MKTVSPLQLAAIFSGAAADLKHQHHAMEKVGELIENTAKAAIGDPHNGMQWPPLKPETIARKANGDTPLLETGELRDSIEHKVLSHNHVAIGTNDPRAVFHEYGTRSIPPRPFLWGAWEHVEHKVKEIVGHGVFGKLTSER